MFEWLWPRRGAPAQSEQEAAELAGFLADLEAMDDDALGFVVAFASDERRKREAAGAMPLHPAQELRRNPRAIAELAAEIASPAVAAAPHRADALKVWLHSLRAGAPDAPPALRDLGRRLWVELARGVPQAGGAAMEAAGRGLPEPDIRGHDRIPDGLGPKEG